MTNNLEIPRLLAWRLAGLDPDYTTAQLDADEEELRALLATTDAVIPASVAATVDENAHLPHRVESLSDFLIRGNAAPVVERQEPLKLQHIAVAEGGKLRWMTGRKMQDCELYALPDGAAIRSPLYAEQPAPVAVPDGWKLVPIEPTSSMLEAGKDERMDCFTNPGLSVEGALIRIYSAIINAAPSVLDKVKELNQ